MACGLKEFRRIIEKSMKSKLFKILGVVAVVAIIAAAIVAPAAALTTPTLAVGSTTISIPTTYTVTFTLGLTQNKNAAAFVFTFDSGINVAGVTAAGTTFTAGPGLGYGAVPATTPCTGLVVSGQTITIDTSTATGINVDIGAGAIVQLQFTGVVNPATIGSYGVTVKTAAETTGVYSNTITTTIPTTNALPGVAAVYNSAGIFMTQSNDLAVAIAYVTTNSLTSATIKVSAGTYSTNFPNSAMSFTIQGTDASAANVILASGAAWQLTGATVVIDSVTIDNTFALTMSATTSGTISNSNLKNGAVVVSTAKNTFNKDTFTVKTGAKGISSTAAVTATGCTFTMTGTGQAISSSDSVTASGDTFNGTAATAPTQTGLGIVLTGGTASVVGTSTFTGLTTALSVTTAAVSFNGNTVTSCGMTSGPDAIMVVSTAGTGVNLYNNNISKSLEYIINVAANDNLVVVMGNQFSANVKNATNTGGVGKLNVTHNYWGGTSSNPASTSTVDYSNPLGAAPTAGALVIGTAPQSLTSATTAGVNVSGATGAGAVVLGAAALGANPVTPTLPSNVTLQRYFDVYGVGATAGTIDLYGTTASPVTANSGIYYYNTAFGTWSQITSATVNPFAGYAEFILGGTNAPTATQFNGDLQLALVSIPTTLGGVTGTNTTLYPLNGAVNVPITNMTFTWPAVTGSGITYQFALAQASANTSANEFAILDYSDNTLTNAEPSQETLAYNTVYWWEVRAVTLNSSGAVAATGPWSVQMFTTMPAPVTTTGTSVTPTTIVTSVVITQPVTTVVSTQTSVVITQTTGNSTPAIPSYLLWAVIAVGAVLIIAVIVLIVRTRRIP
jgi:hypothetical protein